MSAAPAHFRRSDAGPTSSGLGRAAAIWTALAIVMIAVALAGPAIGPTRINLFRAFGFGAAPGDGFNTDAQIFFSVRLPRVLFGLIAGAALAMAGAVFQAVLRNDLATPYTLGVSGGASLGALLVMRFAPAALAGAFLAPVASFVFALLAIGVIYSLARLRGPTTPPVTLLLAGVTLNLLFSALILLIQYLSDPYQTMTIIRWLMGGLDVDSTRKVALVAAVVAAGGIVLVIRSRDLNVLSFGESAAAHLGVDVERARWTLLGAASLMTAAVVSFSGPIGFVGLIVPHALRRVIGPDHRVLLPSTALAGASFLVICDTIARSISESGELPVGIITSFCGAPFFLWILFGRRSGAA